MPAMNIPTPNRGQPLDVDYISTIVTQINTIGNLVNNATAYSQIDSGSNPVNKRTNEIQMVGKTVTYTKQNDEKVSSEITITFPPFINIPIATATVVSATDVGDKSTVVLKSLTTQSAQLKVDFGEQTGQADIKINFIAIGIPATYTS